MTSSQTSTASDILINCLKPYMNVILIGGTTEGKNVGSMSFTNQELGVRMQPIVCKLYNALAESDYENGFTADIPMDENTDAARFLPFGNENEQLLHTALSVIDGTWTTDEPQTSALHIATLGNSVARQATHSVRIDPGFKFY